jgi:glutamate--cysteine ligase
MSTRQDSVPSPPVGSFDDLVAWIAAGSKPKERWRIGTEHEKFLFHTDSLGPVPYAGPRGVRSLMEGLISRYGWVPIMEGDNIIALKRPSGEANGGTVSLEPGGQFELSGAPLQTVHQLGAETQLHLDQVRAVGAALGIGFLGVGFSPSWTFDETPRMPKQRYGVMTRYMPLVGSRGLDMMYRTATIQVNLDFADEADMVKKLRVSLALQPIATAIFACSPFSEKKPNGFLSLRSEVWRDTDQARTGMLPFAFEPGMGFERYAAYALDVPMYFVYRDGRYIDVAGASFRDFLVGRLPALPGERPTLDDWSDHLTTLFPEVRLKQFLEMRGADGGRWRRICAVAAFWTGLFYDAEALDAAWHLIKTWSAAERQGLRDVVPRLALAAPVHGTTALEIARQATALARGGLARRARHNGKGQDETIFLEPVEAIVADGLTPAQEMLARYETVWASSTDPLFTEFAF